MSIHHNEIYRGGWIFKKDDTLSINNKFYVEHGYQEPRILNCDFITANLTLQYYSITLFENCSPLNLTNSQINCANDALKKKDYRLEKWTWWGDYNKICVYTGDRCIGTNSTRRMKYRCK